MVNIFIYYTLVYFILGSYILINSIRLNERLEFKFQVIKTSISRLLYWVFTVCTSTLVFNDSFSMMACSIIMFFASNGEFHTFCFLRSLSHLVR